MHGGETDADVDADVDSDADADADTDTPTGTAPSRLEVACDPTDNALRFTCTVEVEPPQPVAVRWVRADGLGPLRTLTSGEVRGEHAVPVYFLAPEQQYTVEAHAVGWPAEVAAAELTAGAVEERLESTLDGTGTSTLGLIGTEAPCTEAAYAVIYDTSTGDLVWYQELDPDGTLGMLDMVRFTDDQTVIGETGDRGGLIVEVDLLGQDLTRFPVSYPGCCSLNHDVYEHDGMYWSQYQHSTGGLTLDDIVVLDANGVEQYVWHPEEHLDIPGNAFGDYLHTNSEYVDADGDFYLSWLTRNSVAKFEGDRADPAWGDPIWIMTGNGQPGAFGNDITLDWSAVPGADSFGGQHNFHVRRDGRLMLLDSDHGRGLVLTVDEATMTGTVDAAHATREGNCGPQGTAMDTHAGNAVVACATAWVREYDQTSGDLLWEAEIQCPNGGGGGWTRRAATRWYPLDGWHEATVERSGR